MLNVSEELKELYRKETTWKELVLFFPTINKTITNDGIVMESMKLTESICEAEDLTFGGCNSAMFEISIFNVTEDLKGQKMVVTQRVYKENSTTEYLTMPLGTYYVDSLKKQTNGVYTDLVAYDSMKNTDVDVSEWYNGLTFPITIKRMRESLYTFLGLSYEVQALPLDDISISKTVNPSYWKARDVLTAISEANATFGKITREDKVKHIGLGGIGLYPSETLYPSEDLYPSESTETQSNGRLYDAWFEDYIVESIDSISIVDADGVVGITVGEESLNPYIIKGNFIFYGMDNDTLETVANRLLLSVKNKFYRPCDVKIVGLPYLEVGDTIACVNDDTTIETFMFERVLSGIQALEDNVIAKGNATRKNSVDVNTQIEQLNGKTLKLAKSVDGVSVELSDLATDTSEKFEISNGQIVFKANAQGKIVQVALTSSAEDGSEFTVLADSIKLEGYTSINNAFSIDTSGNLIINSNQLTLDANGNAVFKGTVQGSSFIGGTIRIGTTNTYLDVTNSGALSYHDDLPSSNLTRGVYFGVVTGLSTRGIGVYQNMGGYITESYMTDTEVNTMQVNGLTESADLFNPYLNGKEMARASTQYIRWKDNGNNNCVFGGTSLYGASTSWVLANFEQKASDERLKENIVDMKDITNVYMAFQAKEWNPKEKTMYRKKIHQTLTAQGVMKAFSDNGLDWSKYDIIEEKSITDTDFCGDISDYTDGENYFVINDKNLHAYHISFNQSLYRKVQAQEETIHSLQSELSELKGLLQSKGVI